MSKNPDKNLEQALNIAKSHMSVDMLTPELLFVAMVHSHPYKEDYPQLAEAFPLSPAVDPPKEKVRSSEELKK